jgi:hypothetical protein
MYLQDLRETMKEPAPSSSLMKEEVLNKTIEMYEPKL